MKEFDLIKKITEFKTSNKLSDRELAELFGVSRSTLHKRMRLNNFKKIEITAIKSIIKNFK